MARFAYADPIEPDLEWDAPDLLLQLVLAGCPLADVGTRSCETLIELHIDADRLLAIEDRPVELHGTARELATINLW